MSFIKEFKKNDFVVESSKSTQLIPIDDESLQYITQYTEKSVDLFIPFNDKAEWKGKWKKKHEDFLKVLEERKKKADNYITFSGLSEPVSEKQELKKNGDESGEEIKCSNELILEKHELAKRPASGKKIKNKELNMTLINEDLKQFETIELEEDEYIGKNLDEIEIKTRHEFSTVNVTYKFII
jgi:hypothetical protein